jgi:hypothetical protein
MRSSSFGSMFSVVFINQPCPNKSPERNARWRCLLFAAASAAWTDFDGGHHFCQHRAVPITGAAAEVLVFESHKFGVLQVSR